MRIPHLNRLGWVAIIILLLLVFILTLQGVHTGSATP